MIYDARTEQSTQAGYFVKIDFLHNIFKLIIKKVSTVM